MSNLLLSGLIIGFALSSCFAKQPNVVQLSFAEHYEIPTSIPFIKKMDKSKFLAGYRKGWLYFALNTRYDENGLITTSHSVVSEDPYSIGSQRGYKAAQLAFNKLVEKHKKNRPNQ